MAHEVSVWKVLISSLIDWGLIDSWREFCKAIVPGGLRPPWITPLDSCYYVIIASWVKEEAVTTWRKYDSIGGVTFLVIASLVSSYSSWILLSWPPWCELLCHIFPLPTPWWWTEALDLFSQVILVAVPPKQAAQLVARASIWADFLNLLYSVLDEGNFRCREAFGTAYDSYTRGRENTNGGWKGSGVLCDTTWTLTSNTNVVKVGCL